MLTGLEMFALRAVCITIATGASLGAVAVAKACCYDTPSD
jgi:hypothetical protein